MRTSTKFGRPLLGSLAVLLLPVVAFRPAPASTAVSGVLTLAYANPSVLTGTDAKGASVFVSTARGRNQNTGEGDYLADARVVAVDTAAMVDGNGTHSGYVTLSEGSSTVVKRFTGATTTTMVKGQPESTLKGTWTIVRGTGRYAGITGNGTYTGRFETAMKYTVEWKGNTSR